MASPLRTMLFKSCLHASLSVTPPAPHPSLVTGSHHSSVSVSGRHTLQAQHALQLPREEGQAHFPQENAIQSPDLPPVEAQEEAAQLIEPLHSQGASESDSIVVRTSQSGDTIILEEPNNDTADKAATDERTSTAIAFKNRAVKCMAATDTNAIK